ncbi:MAG: sulfonate transport system substrate-binding protein [Desulfovibrionales bacterium]|nr:sulfonate transport system substrate-binding protein [Desulfovibrionales bacterium]
MNARLRRLGLVMFATACAVLAAGAVAAGELKELNISYVKAPFNLQVMVMRSQQMLEKEFAPDGVEVRWREITSGAKQAEAMAAGSLDIASVINTTSVLLANAGGNRIKIIGGVSRPSRTFAIVAGKNGPATVAELKGKIVAGPKGTVLHQMLLAALAKEGLKASDVKFVNMKLPQARTAMLSGSVDAALLAASLVIKSEEAGAHVIVTADGLVTPKLVSAASEAFAAEHPDVVARYEKVFRKAMDFTHRNPAQAVAIGAKEHGVSIKDGQILADWAGFTDHLDASDIVSMRDDLEFLQQNDMLKQAFDPATACLPIAFME